jgi:hypothetical protein
VGYRSVRGRPPYKAAWRLTCPGMVPHIGVTQSMFDHAANERSQPFNATGSRIGPQEGTQ